jgi:hypothetical protein
MRTYLRLLTVVALYLGAAEFAFLAFIQNPGNPHEFEKARLTELIDGSAYRPFVYRTLLPSTVRLALACLPDSAEARIGELAAGFRPLRELLEATPAADERHPAAYLIAYGLEFACLIGFAAVLRAAVIHFYAPRAWLADLLPVGALLCLPVFFRYVSYDYDFPQLFLFSLGLLLLAKRDWKCFYPVLVLGAFNKETAILLAMVHLLGHWNKMPRRDLLAHTLVQVLIVTGVRCLLQFLIFADNPGVPTENWYARNLEMIADPSRWGFLFFHFHWVGRTSLVVPTNYNLLFLLLVPAVLRGWSDKPILLRRGLWILPVLMALTFFMGYFDEMRDYYEAYPIAFLLIAGTACRPARPQPVPPT